MNTDADVDVNNEITLEEVQAAVRANSTSYWHTTPFSQEQHMHKNPTLTVGCLHSVEWNGGIE